MDKVLPVIRGDYTAIDTYKYEDGKCASATSAFVYYTYAKCAAPINIQPPTALPPTPTSNAAPPLGGTRVLALTGENDIAAGVESMSGWRRFVQDPATQFAQVRFFRVWHAVCFGRFVHSSLPPPRSTCTAALVAFPTRPYTHIYICTYANPIIKHAGGVRGRQPLLRQGQGRGRAQGHRRGGGAGAARAGREGLMEV